jgi:hypothetical protein
MLSRSIRKKPNTHTTHMGIGLDCSISEAFGDEERTKERTKERKERRRINLLPSMKKALLNPPVVLLGAGFPQMSSEPSETVSIVCVCVCVCERAKEKTNLRRIGSSSIVQSSGSSLSLSLSLAHSSSSVDPKFASEAVVDRGPDLVVKMREQDAKHWFSAECLA